MRIKGVSAAKGASDILHLESAPALNRRTAMPARSNSNPSLTLYLLQQQKRRLIKEREKLKLKHIANERALYSISKQLDQLIKLNPSLSVHLKELSGLKEEKKLNKIRLDY